MEEQNSKSQDDFEQAYILTIAQEQQYHSKKASKNHRWANRCDIGALVGTTLVATFAAFNITGENIFIGVATPLIGGMTAIIQGVNKICKFDRVGDRCRITSEKLKAVQRSYSANMIDFHTFSVLSEKIISQDVEQFQEDSQQDSNDYNPLSLSS